MRRITHALSRLSLAQQFMLANLVVLTISMIVIGWWVGRQIETGVIDRTAAQTALYVDSFIDPPLQALSAGATLTAEGAALLDRLIEDTPLGQQIVAFKIWDTHGRIVYSTNPALIGQTYPIKDELANAINGEVVSHISDLSDTENLLERGRYTELLETYSPVQASGTNRVIAVAEFYQPVDALRQQIAAARLSSWLVVGAGTLLVYLALTGIVRRGSRTIDRQRAALRAQVEAGRGAAEPLLEEEGGAGELGLRRERRQHDAVHVAGLDLVGGERPCAGLAVDRRVGNNFKAQGYLLPGKF